MFRGFRSQDRAGKVIKAGKASKKSSFTQHQKAKLHQKLDSPPIERPLTSPIISLVVGPDERMFAAHEEVLCISPYFEAALKGQFLEGTSKKVVLPDVEPEVFSAVLEYLYKGDYSPRLLHNKRRNNWELEDPESPKTPGGRGNCSSTIYHSGVGDHVLKDTAIYCLAERFFLNELKRLALRKQGLQTGIQVDVILRSARFAYENTPDTDDHLRAHYLSLIIRSRKVFKRSGTMQTEMELGGSNLFFDLFVAMSNHIDDIVEAANKSSPRTI